MGVVLPSELHNLLQDKLNMNISSTGTWRLYLEFSNMFLLQRNNTVHSAILLYHIYSSADCPSSRETVTEIVCCLRNDV